MERGPDPKDVQGGLLTYLQGVIGRGLAAQSTVSGAGLLWRLQHTHTQKTQNNKFSLPGRQPVKIICIFILFFKHPDQYCLVTTTLTDSTLRPDYSTRPLFPVSHKTFHNPGINARATAYQALFHASSASITNRVYFIPSGAVSENCHWRLSVQSPASLLDRRSQPSSTRRGLPR